jgi:zinc/manganese transport system permease protein
VFSGLMMNTWIAATIVAVIAGVLGFFAVLRGQSFAAHAIPNGAFAGAAGAGLLGLNVIWGLAVFAIGGALGIGALGRRARQDVVTALVLVLLLGTGALFLSFSTEYAEVTYSLLFGEVFGVSSNVLLPIAAFGAVSVAVMAVIYRPLLLASALPEVADARGVSTRRMELCFLLIMGLAATMTVPVVGALLMFALMIGPAAAARSFTKRPGPAIALAIGIALVSVWVGIATSYHTNWPLGFFVGVIAAGFFLLGQGWTAIRRHGFARRPAPALGSAVLCRTGPWFLPRVTTGPFGLC